MHKKTQRHSSACGHSIDALWATVLTFEWIAVYLPSGPAVLEAFFVYTSVFVSGVRARTCAQRERERERQKQTKLEICRCESMA